MDGTSLQTEVKYLPGSFFDVDVPDEYFDCAVHSVILTHMSVEEHLASAHFEIVETHPKFLPYSFRSRLPATRITTKLYLNSKWAWKFLGKQFLVIAKKPN